MTGHRTFTPESLHAVAVEAREAGYGEIADLFESAATKTAKFNEHSRKTVQELRESLGEDEFWRIFNSMDKEGR